MTEVTGIYKKEEEIKKDESFQLLNERRALLANQVSHQEIVFPRLYEAENTLFLDTQQAIFELRQAEIAKKLKEDPALSPMKMYEGLFTYTIKGLIEGCTGVATNRDILKAANLRTNAPEEFISPGEMSAFEWQEYKKTGRKPFIAVRAPGAMVANFSEKNISSLKPERRAEVRTLLVSAAMAAALKGYPQDAIGVLNFLDREIESQPENSTLKTVKKAVLPSIEKTLENYGRRKNKISLPNSLPDHGDPVANFRLFTDAVETILPSRPSSKETSVSGKKTFRRIVEEQERITKGKTKETSPARIAIPKLIS